MSREDKPPLKESNSVSTWQIGFLFAFLAIFAPAYVIIYWSTSPSLSLHIFGMITFFLFDGTSGNWWIESSFFAFGQSMIYTLLRPVFAFQMVRYYQGKSSKKVTFLVGLITELWVITLNFQTTLWFTDSNLILRLPIPFLLLAAIIVMRVAPPQKRPELWLEKKDEGRTWWKLGNGVADTSQENGVHSFRIEILYKALETVLVSEIILLILGGIIVSNMHPIPLQIFYWMVIPWSILITGVLFLIIRHLRR